MASNPPTPAQKQALIEALNEHRINTIGGLRNVERIFAQLGSPDVTQPMTAACTLYSLPNPPRITNTSWRGLLCQFQYAAHRAPQPHPQLPVQVISAHNPEPSTFWTDQLHSSDILTAAKFFVHADPASNRSWNYCWLILTKIRTQSPIPTFAQAQAAKPEIWAGRIPLGSSVDALTAAFVAEWKRALERVLRYWEVDPVR